MIGNIFMNNRFKPGVDFQFVPIENSERYAVKFITGEYKDTTVAFGIVKPTLKANEQVQIDFEYQIISGNFKLEKNIDFEQYIAEYLAKTIIGMTNNE